MELIPDYEAFTSYRANRRTRARISRQADWSDSRTDEQRRRTPVPLYLVEVATGANWVPSGSTRRRAPGDVRPIHSVGTPQARARAGTIISKASRPDCTESQAQTSPSIAKTRQDLSLYVFDRPGAKNCAGNDNAARTNISSNLGSNRCIHGAPSTE